MTTSTATRPATTPLGRRTSLLATRYRILCRCAPGSRTADRLGAELVRETEKLVGYRASRMVRPNPRYDEEDLRQDGYEGAIRAARGYDPALGAYSTHATSWIIQKIMRGRDAVAYPVHVPSHVRVAARRWRKAGKPEDRDMERLDALCREHDLPDFSAAMATRPAPGPDDDAGRDEAIDALRAAVERLREILPRYAEVLCRNRGVFGREPETLVAIAKSLGISKERARQIRDKSLAMVREFMTESDGEAAA